MPILQSHKLQGQAVVDGVPSMESKKHRQGAVGDSIFCSYSLGRWASVTDTDFLTAAGPTQKHGSPLA